MKAVAWCLIMLCCISLVGCSTATKVVAMTGDGGKVVCIRAEVADTPEKRMLGLSRRASLPQDGGMLFVFGETVSYPFWMKDTYIPLSIAFISEEGLMVDIQDMEPLSERSHYSTQPYRYALEANQGFFQRNGIAVGGRVEFR